jgi:hypothetical protein
MVQLLGELWLEWWGSWGTKWLLHAWERSWRKLVWILEAASTKGRTVLGSHSKWLLASNTWWHHSAKLISLAEWRVYAWHSAVLLLGSKLWNLTLNAELSQAWIKTEWLLGSETWRHHWVAHAWHTIEWVLRSEWLLHRAELVRLAELPNALQSAEWWLAAKTKGWLTIQRSKSHWWSKTELLVSKTWLHHRVSNAWHTRELVLSELTTQKWLASKSEWAELIRAELWRSNTHAHWWSLTELSLRSKTKLRHAANAHAWRHATLPRSELAELIRTELWGSRTELTHATDATLTELSWRSKSEWV